MAAINYSDSGVNRNLADQFVEKIAHLSKATFTAKSSLQQKIKSAVGGYASLYALDQKRLLAASTDGVGTKLKLAGRLREHGTIGIDLVAMSVNDLLCVGAEPLFFLDYFATSQLDAEVAEAVLSGIVEGCKQAQCALVGGETAEMPDFYSPGEYDLAGFAVGLVNTPQVLPRQKKIRAGDCLIGIGSSGCHSNGYSLLRKLLPRGREGDRIARELLTPTRIYVRSLLPLIRSKKFKGLAHITGSGFLNVPRMSEEVSYAIQLPPEEELPAIYDWVRSASGLSLEELAQTFNLGIGMVAVVAPKDKAEVLRKLKKSGEKAWVVGEVVESNGQRNRSGSQVFLKSGSHSATLAY